MHCFLKSSVSNMKLKKYAHVNSKHFFWLDAKCSQSYYVLLLMCALLLYLHARTCSFPVDSWHVSIRRQASALISPSNLQVPWEAARARETEHVPPVRCSHSAPFHLYNYLNCFFKLNAEMTLKKMIRVKRGFLVWLNTFLKHIYIDNIYIII